MYNRHAMRFLGGTKNQQDWYWEVSVINDDMPPLEDITAAVGIMKYESHYLAIKNSRGWDIPGGHREIYESCEETLRRECFEEAQVLLGDVKPVISLTSTLDGKRPTYIILFIGIIHELQKFVPTDEVVERALFSEEELIDRYFGNSKMLRHIFSLLESKK